MEKNIYLYIAVMAGVSYMIRVLPAGAFHLKMSYKFWLIIISPIKIQSYLTIKLKEELFSNMTGQAIGLI